jgi:hypothetical protein
MKPSVNTLASVLLAVAIGPASVTLTRAADDKNNPLDPSYMSEQEKAYFKEKVGEMDPKGAGTVTKDGFINYYSNLWDKNAPNKTAVTANQLSQKWAAMEEQNPLNPEYKTVLWRNAHVKTMDTNTDDSVTKEEFLKHMETHWVEETQQSKSTALTHEQAMQAMTRNPLDPNYKPH